jgi:hypothetical protein
MKVQLNEIKRMQKLAGILNENFDHEMDAYRNDPKFYMDLKAKEKEGPVKFAADTALQNYDDYMDNAYGKDRFGMTNEDDIDDFASSLKAGDNKGFVIATDEDNDFEIDGEISDILKKNGADESNFQIISKVNFDNLSADQLKNMRDKLIIRKRK